MGYVFWIIYFVYSGEAYDGCVRYRNLIVGTYVGRLERNKSCTIYNRFVYRTRKDRMRIREMKKIGLWREETTRDVTKYSECNWVYGKIILKPIRNAKAMKFQIVASGKELAKFADQKIVTFYYFRRSRIIERIAFDEKPEEKK